MECETTILWNELVREDAARASVDSSRNITSTIAADISANCEAYDAGVIPRGRWDVEQNRLWKQAAAAGCAAQVLTLVRRTSASGPKE